MSRILLVSYYFPPIGGAGAQRPAKFARYLADHGHSIVVLTGAGETGRTWTPPDESLLLDLPPGMEIVRVPGPEPQAQEGLRRRVQRLTRRETDWARWWQMGVVAAAGELADIDVVYTIMSPFSSARPSLALARSLGVGWVADLGDPWALDEMVVYPTGLHRRLEIARMRRLLGSAAAVVMSTPEAVRQVVETFPELSGRPVVAISNGYDAADFTGETVTGQDPTKFRIVHTGYLHTDLGLQQRRRKHLRRLLGGGVPGVDILTRSHVYLLDAVDRLLVADPTLHNRLEIHLAGVLSDTDRRIAARSPVTVLHGYLSHADSIALMRSADLLFLPMQNLPAGRRSTTVPGKTYEYLASGRPILAAVPPGDTRDILERSGRALLCPPDDTAALESAIAEAMSREGPTPRAAGEDNSTRQFAYDRLVDDVAAVIDQAVIRSIPARTPPRRIAAPHEGELTVLLIAYHFPPIGGAGAQRSLKFARYLPEHGCRVVVITGPGEISGRWTPTDETLLDDLSATTGIVRLAGSEPSIARGWQGRFNRWLRMRAEWSRWWVDGVVEAAREVADVDVILVSASPYDSVEAGAKLARKLGKPWIAGLRDPWALDEMTTYPTGLHRRLEIARMRRLLGSAAAVVMNTPEAVRQVVETFPELSGRPVVAISNGYDAADFTGETVTGQDPTKFRIVHTGYLHTDLGLQQRRRKHLRRLLGGGVPGVDILTRSHVYLLDAVDRLLVADPTLHNRLEIHLAGVLSDTDRRIAARSPVTVLHGYLSHADSIALMRSADLLFLPMQNLPAGRRSTTVPGKTYEYLASGRPILATVPPGDTRETIEAVGHMVCDPDDVAAMADAIVAAVARHDTKQQPEFDMDLVQSFERRELTRQLAALMYAIGGTAATAGASELVRV